jgi:DNA mismatch endonuclease (patch repair protein)
MARVRQKGTDAELLLRKELHARGLRYRLQVPLLTKPRRVADIVFPEHASWPKSNAQFWRDKIEANRARDADTDRRLSASGWRVIRVWAHERAGEAAERIENVVRGGGGLQ